MKKELTSEWSRREFVKSAGAFVTPVLAGCSAALTSEKPAERAVPRLPADERHLRIGLIGCGHRGSGAVVQALKADKNSTLVAMGDVFADHIENSVKAVNASLEDEAPRRIQVPPERRFVGIDAYRKVLEAGVDVVLLTSYPHFYPEHLRAAVEAGKHVFVEKPLAVDAPGCARYWRRPRGPNRRICVCWSASAGVTTTG